MEKDTRVSLLLDFYGELLKPSSREMTTLYYNDDLSLAEIAEDVGITRQGVRDSIKRCEKQLFELEDKLKMLSRFQQLEEELDLISRDALKIIENTDNSEVQRLARQIEARADRLKE